MNVEADIAFVIRMSVIGIGLAVVAAIVGIWRRLSPSAMSIIFLAITAAGAVPAYLNGIALGMDIADTYYGTGGAHTIWPGVLYGTSLAALACIGLIIVLRRRRSTSAGSGATPRRS